MASHAILRRVASAAGVLLLSAGVLTAGCAPFTTAALSGTPVTTVSPIVMPPPGVMPGSPQWVTYAQPVPFYIPAGSPTPSPPGTVRYRLRLRDNPEDSVGAHRCYAECRTEATQASLLECLAHCPGFEITSGAVCGAAEGPPRSVCITHRVEPRPKEADPGLVLIAILADFALYVGLASACGPNNPGCALYNYYPY